MYKKLLQNTIVCLSCIFSTSIAHAQIDVVPASAAGICDGSAALTNTAGVISNSVVWSSNGALIATNTTQVGNLCNGAYNVSYAQTTAAGGIDSLTYTFQIGIGANPCATLSATIIETPSSTPTSNDGIMTGNASGGNPPYLFMWSNGAITQSINTLQASLEYCLYVQDAANCMVGPICDSISVVNPTMGDTLVVGGANCGPINTTVFMQELEDCNFDFNACTSAYLTYIDLLGNDSIQATWNFVDTNGMITNYFIHYYAPNPQNFPCYNLQFTLFCSVIKSSNIKTIVVTDAAQISGSGLQELSKKPFCINNPVGNELNITFNQAFSGTLHLLNLNGQVLKGLQLNAAKQTKISMAEFSSGTYFLQLEDGNHTYTEKIIK